MSNARNLSKILSSGSLGKPANRQVFTASGTWTKPTGFGSNAMVLIEAWGGGGSGNKHTGSTSMTGGGGGGYNSRLIPLSSLGATETVTIGQGGAAQTVANAAGNSGGNSSFGSRLTAYAGSGGGIFGLGYGGGGGGQLSASTNAYPGLPWFVCDNDGVSGNYYQGQGSDFNYSASNYGAYKHGGGGGSSGITGSRPGGTSVYGGGGGGASTGAGGISSFGGNGGAGGVTGVAGTAPGGGGGNGTTGSSGAGARGEIRITVFDGQ